MSKQEIKLGNTNLKVHYVQASLLRPAEYNPRRWSETAIEQLKESIKRFGLVDPFLVNSAPNRKNIIIGGHFRWAMAKELGIKEVPVVYINIPDIEREKELNLRLNRNTGEWDFEILKSFEINLLLDVGFDDSDLSSIWDDALGIEDDGFEVEKELKKIKETKIRPGDLFALGQHKLLCADSTDPNTVKMLIGTSKVNVIDVDIPFNIGLSYNSGIGGKQNYGGNTNDKKTDREYRLFVKNIIENGLSVAHEDCHIFIWSDEKYIGMLQELYKEAGIDQKRLCMWLKDNQNPTPQVAFNKVTEFCLYGTRGKPYLSAKVKNLNEILNKEVTTGNRLIDDILDLLNIWLVKRLPGNEYMHPTQKPPTLYEKALRRCSKPGDTVLDLCAGSGALMSACEQLKRTAYLVEIEPIFCQLIINRYENLTKTKVKKLN